LRQIRSVIERKRGCKIASSGLRISTNCIKDYYIYETGGEVRKSPLKGKERERSSPRCTEAIPSLEALLIKILEQRVGGRVG